MESPGMKRLEILAGNALDAFQAALRATAIGMRRAIEQFEQRFDRADRRVVLVLPDCREALDLALDELVLRKKRPAHDVEHDREHAIEILRHACAADNRRMPRRRYSQRDATIVQFFCEHVGGTGLCPAIQDTPEQVGQAGPV